MFIRSALSLILVLTAIAAFAVGNCDGAGNCYVASFATGTGTGADWTNACTDFTGACDVTDIAIRGTTIWVGGVPGNPIGAPYAHTTFSAPDNGTLRTTIMGATTINHGTDTGWRRQYATGVVPFLSLNITTDYWTFDGQVRPIGGGTAHDQSIPVWSGPVGGYSGAINYHMMVTNVNGSLNGAVQISGSHVYLAFLMILGSMSNLTFGGTSYTDAGVYYAPGVTDEYLGYSWIFRPGGDLISASSGSSFTFEYNLLSMNHAGSPTAASSAISVGNLTGLIVRYNHFQNPTGAAVLTDSHVTAAGFVPNWYIYGNDIFWNLGPNAIHTGVGYGLSAGIVNLTGETFNGGVIHVYNNTIANINNAACVSVQPCNSYALNLNGTTGGSCAAHTQNCGTTVATVYNNLWWDAYRAANILVNNAANPQWTPTADYGEGICPAAGCSNNGTTFRITGSNDIALAQGSATSSGNPFVAFADFVPNYAFMGGANWYPFNLQVRAETAPGLTIPGWTSTPAGCTSNCESNDAMAWYGAAFTRGVNATSTVSRGAFQFPPARHLVQINSTNIIGASNSSFPAVTVTSTGTGVHFGQTYQYVPLCFWSAPPTYDNCPNQTVDGVTYTQQWASLDPNIATLSSTGLLTGVSNHNTFIRFRYGGFTTYNPVAVVTSGTGAEPVAALPNGIVRTGSPLAFSGYDTTQYDFNFPTTITLPAGCPPSCSSPYRYVSVTTSAALNTAIQNSQPGDVITLQAGVTYQAGVAGSGFASFVLPARPNPNHLWTYIVSRDIASLPPQGSRVVPVRDRAYMPVITGVIESVPIEVGAGADHWWIAGIEITDQQPCPAPCPTPITSSTLLTTAAGDLPTSMPDSITVDRCYIHGDSNHNVAHAIVPNASHFAIMDSYIADIETINQESQAISPYQTPGPLKITNNFLSAFGENFLTGGSGGFSNWWVISDVYIHGNNFWIDPAGRVIGVAVPPRSLFDTKNNLELKNCQRCLIDGNVMENGWVSGQLGGAVLWNAGTGVNGPDNVISDITFSNNIMVGTISGLSSGQFASRGLGCSPGDEGPGINGYINMPACWYPGENRRVNEFNNLFIQGSQNEPGGRLAARGNSSALVLPRVNADWSVRHNTYVGRSYVDAVSCDESIRFEGPFYANTSLGWVDNIITTNQWINDNVLCRKVINGLGSADGLPVLTSAMSDPTTVPFATTRFRGNLMQYFTSRGDVIPTGANAWPATNFATTANFNYINPAIRNYQLVSQPGGSPSDGASVSGINYSVLMSHQISAPLTITGLLPNSQVGMAYPDSTPLSAIGQTLIANGGTPPYTWSVISGTLPSGLSLLNYFGATMVSGIPDTIGTSTFTIQVKDAAGVIATQLYNVNIAGCGLIPVINSILGNTLPAGTIGNPYSYQPTTTCGSGTISSWAVWNVPFLSSMAICPTLTAAKLCMNGQTGLISSTSLAGTGNPPVTPTTIAFEITATDNAGHTSAPQVFTLLIGAGAQYSIMGTVSGAVANSVSVIISGCIGGSTTTDSTGAYLLPNVPGNTTCTVTPSRAGYTFTPPSATVPITTANVTNVNFTSVAATSFTISGTISGAVAQGAILTMTGCASGSVISSASGAYTLTGALPGICTVTPSETNFVFSPTSIPVTITTSNVVGVNFTAARIASLAGLDAGSIGPSGTTVLNKKKKKP